MPDLAPGHIEIKLTTTSYDLTEAAADYFTDLLERYPWEVVRQSKITEIRADSNQPARVHCYLEIVRKEKPDVGHE